jgi:hypothetical protein
MVRNIKFYDEALLATRPTPKRGPPLVGCLRLLQFIRRYPPFLEAVPPFATLERAMLWSQEPTYRELNNKEWNKISNTRVNHHYLYILWRIVC